LKRKNYNLNKLKYFRGLQIKPISVYQIHHADSATLLVFLPKRFTIRGPADHLRFAGLKEMEKHGKIGWNFYFKYCL